MFFRSKKKRSCEHAMELIQSYVDGELPASQAQSIEEHLAMCVGCDDEADIFAQIVESIKRQAKISDEHLTKLNDHIQRLCD